jgi:CO/xanthine dehydrogenase FAD-binding subunit
VWFEASAIIRNVDIHHIQEDHNEEDHNRLGLGAFGRCHPVRASVLADAIICAINRVALI